MSPLKAAARTVDTDVEAVRWNKVALQNRAIGDGAFTFPNPLTREQWEQAREQVKRQYEGVENARRPWVLGSGATYNRMSLTPVEMDWLAIGERPLSREGWLWPAPGNPEARSSDALAARQLLRAEALAGLPKLNGSTWHAYRRWFGTRNKHNPTADVEAVGGWGRNSAALRTCYQLPDPEGMAKVVHGTDSEAH